MLDTYKKKPIEVIEKSDVLVLGIQEMSNGLLPELVIKVSIIELKLIKKSIELVWPKEDTMEKIKLKTMLVPN